MDVCVYSIVSSNTNTKSRGLYQVMSKVCVIFRRKLMNYQIEKNSFRFVTYFKRAPSITVLFAGVTGCNPTAATSLNDW